MIVMMRSLSSLLLAAIAVSVLLTPASSQTAEPTGQPSDVPSMVPSDVPSDVPSMVPSDVPSDVPSFQPSDVPSMVPSDVPSDVPSSMPSDVPSDVPSSQPSSEPSSMPSDVPSSQPSSMPSDVPSSEPSSEPSSIPSSTPSGEPSSAPSDQPSGEPSESPSDEPSSEPSSMPSCTPSSAPTDPATTHMFYPDWTTSESVCLNDGEQPVYMDINPSDFMTSTLESCCKKFFDWDYDKCTGSHPDECARHLFYPDWEGGSETCLNDGNEPAYMNTNSHIYFYNDIRDCCKAFYLWDYYNCAGISNSAANGLYYPDWESSDMVCRADGKQPQYMTNNPTTWMYKTLDECCTKNYGWNYNECMGSGPGPAPSPTANGMYYPDWEGSDEGCLADGNQPDYMTENSKNFMYDTLDACCKHHYNWIYNDCMGVGGGAPAPAPIADAKFYMVWGTTNKCVQDCEVGAGPKCGGRANDWDKLWDTLEKCCKEMNWWNTKCAK